MNGLFASGDSETRFGDRTGREWVLQSALLARVCPCNAESVSRLLATAHDLALRGVRLPPLGVLADLLALMENPETFWSSGRDDGSSQTSACFHFLPGKIRRLYEDHVLGHLVLDASFRRGAEALRKYASQTEMRVQVETMLIERIVRRPAVGASQEGRTELGVDELGVELSSALLRRLQRSQTAEELIQGGWRSLATCGLLPSIPAQYEQWSLATRHSGPVLDAADLFELEAGWAELPPALRLELRQIVDAEGWFTESLGAVRTPNSHRETAPVVSTSLRDDDTYPAGGYASLATRGSIESLLKSQLALLDPDHRPDLFDAKFVRDELLYYCRDENQFRRGTRRVVIILCPSLIRARVKDPALPYQRIVLAFGMLKALFSRCAQLLTDESLVFELVFVEGARELLPEQRLLQLVFARPAARQVVKILTVDEESLSFHIQSRPAHVLRLCYGDNAATMGGTACEASHPPSPSSEQLGPAGTERSSAERSSIGRRGEVVWDLSQPAPERNEARLDAARSDTLASWRAVTTYLLQRWIASPASPPTRPLGDKLP